MKTTLITGTLSLVAAAILTGCGSSTTATSNDDTQTALQTGYFIDAPVEGLSYTTDSGESGVTDNYGRFHYKEGDKVRFMIGKLDLGEATPDQEGLVTPETIADNNETLKVQLLRVLQGLDSDGDPSNGIVISKDVVDALTSLSKDVELSKISGDDEILKLHSTLADKLDKDYDGHIDVDDTKAKTHYENSMQKWESGHKPDDNVSSEGSKWGNQKDSSNENGHSKGGGYGKNGHGKNNSQEANRDGGDFDISQYPISTLTQDVKDALAYMGNEERLAYDVYMNLYDFYQKNGDEIRQFENIASRSEIKHIGIVQDLVRRYNLGASDVTNVENPVADNSITPDQMQMGKYDIPAIQDLYDALYEKGIQSRQDALEVGCMVEVTDVDDLDRWISKAKDANATDVLAGFDILINGSYNHYWAFDKGLKNMGVEQGCAVLGEKYAKTKDEYPSSH